MFESGRRGPGCRTPRPAWAMARRTSASSCDGTRPSILFLCRAWVGFATDSIATLRSDIDGLRLHGNRHRRVGSRAEIVAGHRDARNLLSDGSLDGADHRDLVGRHERVSISGRRGPTGATDSVHVVLGLLRDVIVDD